MGKERTDKSPYQSRFGGGWISAAQWLAENMCSRKSRAEDGGELPFHFWRDPYWEKQLKLQLKHANDLLKEYDVDSIVNALKHPDAKRVYSLGLKSVLTPLIRKENEKNKLHTKLQSKIEIQSVDLSQKPRQPFSKQKSRLQKLREIENG